MSVVKAGTPLMSDLRRMLPVWGIVVGTSVVCALGMSWVANARLAQAIAGEPDACDIAQVEFNAGRRHVDVIRSRVEKDRSADRTKLADSSLGAAKDDPAIAKAIAHLERALQICPARSDAHVEIATLRWYAGERAPALYHLGLYWLALDRRSDALDALTLAAAADPGAVEIQLAYALCLAELGRAEEALAIVGGREAELAKDTKNQLVLGRVFAKTGESERALAVLKPALKADPSDIYAVQALADLFMKEKKFREGADFLNEVGKGPLPFTAVGYHLTAIMAREAGDRPMALAALRETARLAPYNADIHWELSVEEYQNGNKSVARDRLRRALELDANKVLDNINRTGIDPRK